MIAKIARCPDCGRNVIAMGGVYTSHLRHISDVKSVPCTASKMPLVTTAYTHWPNAESDQDCKGK